MAYKYLFSILVIVFVEKKINFQHQYLTVNLWSNFPEIADPVVSKRSIKFHHVDFKSLVDTIVEMTWHQLWNPSNIFNLCHPMFRIFQRQLFYWFFELYSNQELNLLFLHPQQKILLSTFILFGGTCSAQSSFDISRLQFFWMGDQSRGQQSFLMIVLTSFQQLQFTKKNRYKSRAQNHTTKNNMNVQLKKSSESYFFLSLKES